MHITDTEYIDRKALLIPIVLHGIVITYSLIMYFRSRRFLAKLCPSGKMSCIGKYRRNVIDLKTCTLAILYLSFFPISLKLVILTFKPFSLSPEHVILIHTLYNTFGVETFNLGFSLIIGRGKLATRQEPRKVANFYVRRPDLVPRPLTPFSIFVPQPVVEERTRKFHYISNLSHRKNLNQRCAKVVTVGLGRQRE